MAFPPETFMTGQLVTAATLNANVRDNVNALNGGGVVPVGAVALWGGAIAIIPSGWGLCDGGGGRIDLRDYFVISAGYSYNPGDSGGAASTTPAAHSAHTLSQPGAHATHSIGAPDHGSGNLGPNSFNTPHVFLDTVLTFNHAGEALSAHDGHTFGLDSTTHSHGAIALLPPYHARAFMQKASSGLSIGTPRTWTAGEIPSAAMMNAELRDNINYLAALTLPLGTIAIWSNLAASIPSGWSLCDGTNGTPDLRDKYIVGAGNTYAVGATGGTDTATLPAHAAHTPTQAANHADHTASQAGGHTVSSTEFWGSSSQDTLVMQDGTHAGFAVDAHGAHSGFNVNAHSSHAAISILPAFFALCYMQLTSIPTMTTPRTWANGETVQAAQFNTYIRDNELAIQAAQVPIGAVLIWSSTIGSIPAGYTRIPFGDQFVVGAGNSADGHYVPTQTGGANTVTPAAHNDHNVTQPSNHANHVVTQPLPHGTALRPGGGAPFAAGGTHSWTVSAHDGHTVGVDAHSAHAAIATLPPFKAYAYIQRTS